MNQPTYVRRGHRTFIAILIVRLFPLLFFLFTLIVLAVLQAPLVRTLEQIAVNPQGINDIYSYIVGSGTLLFFVLLIVLTIIALFEYFSFSYALTESSLQTRNGIINIQELSISYKQIENIDISRPFLYRLLGMSRVEILTAAQDKNPDKDPYDYSDECIIDIIDKEQADMIRTEINARSEVQLVQLVPTAQHMY